MWNCALLWFRPLMIVSLLAHATLQGIVLSVSGFDLYVKYTETSMAR